MSAIMKKDEREIAKTLAGLVADLNRCLKEAAQSGLTVRLALEKREAQSELEVDASTVLIMGCFKKFI